VKIELWEMGGLRKSLKLIVTQFLSSLFLTYEYFRYSYTSGKFRHTYTGSFFREVAYTEYDVLWPVE
jgi:hypothetical protein